MTDLPAWLSQAQRPGASERPYFDDDPTEVLPGDICIVEPFGHGASIGRLFVIVDAESGWCEGMLASSETELATEVDAILPSSVTGLGYPVAVHSRYSGPIWEQQVRRRVGALEMETLEQLEALTWNDEADVDLTVGMPLQPEGFDPRFAALQALSAELDALTWGRERDLVADIHGEDWGDPVEVHEADWGYGGLVEAHEADWGPFEASRWTGEAWRHCQHPGCKKISD